MTTPQPLMPSALQPARRRHAALAVALLVLLLHAALLGLWPAAPGLGWQAAAPSQPLRVRQIVLSAPAQEPASDPLPQRTPVSPSAAAAPRALPAPAAPAAPVAVEPAALVTGPAAVERGESATAQTPAAPDAAGLSPPSYSARLPGSYTLRYLWQREAAQGRAELRWELQGERYELSLHSERSNGPGLGSASVGRVAPRGLEPERHTESRRGRDVRAANFQRDSDRITFSGPRGEHPLVPGAQDRLSWIVQLPAILEAQPALQTVGSEIAMFVVGSRGDGETWVFTVLGSEDLDLPAGRVAGALHLKREPRRPYDTQAEIWLDPARQHLPVRLRLVVRPTGQGTDFQLDSIDKP